MAAKKPSKNVNSHIQCYKLFLLPAPNFNPEFCRHTLSYSYSNTENTDLLRKANQLRNVKNHDKHIAMFSLINIFSALKLT